MGRRIIALLQAELHTVCQCLRLRCFFEIEPGKTVRHELLNEAAHRR